MIQGRLPRRALLWGAVHAGGILLFLAVLRPSIFRWLTTAETALLAWSTLAGVFVVGAGVGTLSEEYGVIMPAVAVGMSFVGAALASLEGLFAPTASAGPSPFLLYVVYWPVVLLFALLLGGCEHLVRGRLS